MNSKENNYNIFIFCFDILKGLFNYVHEEYIPQIFKSTDQKIRDEDERIKREEKFQQEDNEWFSKVTQR